MKTVQCGVLAPVPPLARYLSFTLKPRSEPRRALLALSKIADGEKCVVGIGESLLRVLDCGIAGMRPFPSYAGVGFEVPATPAALWCWLRGNDRGEIVHHGRAIAQTLAEAFVLGNTIDAFRYGSGLDLTGYEDGTENPHGKKALAAAVVDGMGDGLDGSTFVAVQQWVHDLGRFAAMSAKEQDNTFGRRRRDNKEFDGAPPSAHVKRTAQESFTPEAFVVRRSMPWADATREGLVFVAFGHTLDAYDALLKRMVGAEDGITDALFRFTRPVSGAYFWCPPVRQGRLDLRAVLKK